jgi:DNA modification methylase
MQTIEYVPVSKLRVRSDNPRSINKKQLGMLCESIRNNPDYFETRPILCNKKFEIFAGTQRHMAAKRIGMKEVPVAIMDISEARQREIMLRDNRQSGEWDFSKLKFFDTDLLHNVGFTDTELSGFWTENFEANDDNFPVDKELAKIKKPKTKPGDLIELGPHRLVCGSATDPAVLKRLFGKERASMIYDDPPYNLRGGVDYDKGFGRTSRYGVQVEDNRTDDEYKEFLRQSLVNGLSVSKQDVHVFVWADESNIWVIQTLFRELGIENKRLCLWVKNSQNPVPSVAFSKCIEVCPYGVRGQPYLAKNIQNLNEILNKGITTGNNLAGEALDHLNLWFEKRLPGTSYEHATSKPPSLHNKAIRRCTRPNDIILDSYLGSGSTLIAGEQLKRRVYGCELAPLFCDLIIRRYERLTGRKAKIIRDV